MKVLQALFTEHSQKKLIWILEILETTYVMTQSLFSMTVVKTFIYLWLGHPKLTGKLSRKTTHLSCHGSEICISIDRTLNNLVQRSFSNDRKCFA